MKNIKIFLSLLLSCLLVLTPCYAAEEVIETSIEVDETELDEETLDSTQDFLGDDTTESLTDISDLIEETSEVTVPVETEVVTEAPTEAQTEAPTEAITEAKTEAEAQTEAEVQTEAITEPQETLPEEIVSPDEQIIESPENSLSGYDDDEEDEDESEDESEETEKPAEEINQVSIININSSANAYQKPAYTAKVDVGNAEVAYEKWVGSDNTVNASTRVAYADDDVKFTTFVLGVTYKYSIRIMPKDNDYFASKEDISIWLNNEKLSTDKFTMNSQRSIITITDCFTRKSECQHSYKTITIPATCVKAGKKYDECKYCGSTKNNTVLNPLGHKYEYDEDLSYPPTCEKDGAQIFVCERCNGQLVTPIAKKGHKYVVVQDDCKEPTCTVNGYTHYACTNEDCDSFYRVPIPMLGHAYELNEEDSKEPTCERDGYFLYRCTNEDCSASYKVAISKTGHSYAIDRDDCKEPTCTTDGYTTYACTHEDCNSFYRTTIPKTGHRYQLDREDCEDATCTTKGYVTYVCINDDCDSYYRNYSNPLGHAMGWVTLKTATAKKSGLISYCCQREDCEYEQKRQTTFPYKSIKLSATKIAYTGSAIKPAVSVVTTNGGTVGAGNYTVSYSSNKNVGTAKVHVTFFNQYSGSLSATFKIVKGKQSISVPATSYTLKKSDLKKAAITINLGASAKSSLSYSKSSSHLSVSGGKVKVKKGTPKGTYTVTIKAKGTKNVKAASKKITIKVK